MTASAVAPPHGSSSQTAIRETLEESGIHIRATGVTGVYTDPKHAVHYTSDDEVRQEFTIVYRADYLSGEPTTSDETTKVEWVPIERLAALKMDRSQRMRIEWGLAHADSWIDPPGARHDAIKIGLARRIIA